MVSLAALATNQQSHFGAMTETEVMTMTAADRME
jgi:hypothetical protein